MHMPKVGDVKAIGLEKWLKWAISTIEFGTPLQILRNLFQSFPEKISRDDRRKYEKVVKTIENFLENTVHGEDTDNIINGDEIVKVLRGFLSSIRDVEEDWPEFNRITNKFREPKLFVGAFSLHGFILSTKKHIHCFGWNQHFQLGLGETQSRFNPVLHPKFDRNLSIVRIGCGGWHSLFQAIDSEKKTVILRCGVIGVKVNQDPEDRFFPKYSRRDFRGDNMETPLIVDLNEFSCEVVDVECGAFTSFLILKSGKVLASGLGFDGQLGIGEESEYIREFKGVKIEDKVKSVAAGEMHTLFLTEKGNVLVSGSNEPVRGGYGKGRLGLLSNIEKTYIPVEILQIRGIVKQIGCGSSSSFFLTNDDVVSCCGRLFLDEEAIMEPKPIPSFKCQKFMIGFEHALFLSSDRLFSLGMGEKGQLVTGRNLCEKIPTETSLPFSKERKIRDFHCSFKNSYVLDEDSNIYGCGSGNYGQLLYSLPLGKKNSVCASNLLFQQPVFGRGEFLFGEFLKNERKIKSYFDSHIDFWDNSDEIKELCEKMKDRKIESRKFLSERKQAFLTDWPIFHEISLEKFFSFEITISKSLGFISKQTLTYFGEYDIDTNLKFGRGKEFSKKTGKLIYFGEFRNGKWNGQGKSYKKDGLTLKAKGTFVDGVYSLRNECIILREKVNEQKEEIKIQALEHKKKLGKLEAEKKRLLFETNEKHEKYQKKCENEFHSKYQKKIDKESKELKTKHEFLQTQLLSQLEVVKNEKKDLKKLELDSKKELEQLKREKDLLQSTYLVEERTRTQKHEFLKTENVELSSQLEIVKRDLKKVELASKKELEQLKREKDLLQSTLVEERTRTQKHEFLKTENVKLSSQLEIVKRDLKKVELASKKELEQLKREKDLLQSTLVEERTQTQTLNSDILNIQETWKTFEKNVQKEKEELDVQLRGIEIRNIELGEKQEIFLFERKLVGTTFKAYKKMKPIGGRGLSRHLTGSVGVVYHVKYQGKDLAMKIMLNLDNKGTSTLENVFLGSEFLDRLPIHPSLLRIHHCFIGTVDEKDLQGWDFDEDVVKKKTAFLIMPLCDGNLKSKIELAGIRRPIFKDGEFISFLKQIVEGLFVMKHHNFVHRDIKQDNILVKDGKYLICDFGTCFDGRRFPGFKFPFVTRSDRGGAPFYMPPEIRDRDDIGMNTFLNFDKYDVYSLGIVSFELFSLRKYKFGIKLKKDECKNEKIREMIHKMIASYDERFEVEELREYVSQL